ncbi:nucleotidyltransferase domain-containing protein [Pyrococcus kukulkanii]|uniref:Nucleotidyltransferase n=1 Tax=Pyrococcus kukulkanii TaxID=1609559 RepID=A0A127B8X0_9EURY|nr:nucleotidyltransferase [Pyrococcus kukulkanii]AMM53823.1 nucleotidyltransferase [Pyrococcus kukulkanii]
MQFSGLPIGLSELVRVAKEFKEKREKVFDIVLYGSVTLGKEKPNDYDFMLILKDASAEERFELAFEFKQALLDLGFPHEKLDVKAINLDHLFDPNYLATPGIIIHGYSLTRGEFLHKLMNGEAYALFIIRLAGFDRNSKNKFSFALKGRDGKSGILKELNGKFIAPWVVMIPVENTYRFKEFLDYWRVDYEAYITYGVKASIKGIST